MAQKDLESLKEVSFVGLADTLPQKIRKIWARVRFLAKIDNLL